MTATQLDLIDLLNLPRPTGGPDAVDERALWGELFEWYEVPAPYRCGDGREAGTPSMVVKCPVCGVHEPGEYSLWIDHGYDPGLVDWRRLIGDFLEDPPSCRSERASIDQHGNKRPAGAIPKMWHDARPLGPTRSTHNDIDIERRVLTTMFGTDRIRTIAETQGWL